LAVTISWFRHIASGYGTSIMISLCLLSDPIEKPQYFSWLYNFDSVTDTLYLSVYNTKSRTELLLGHSVTTSCCDLVVNTAAHSEHVKSWLFYHLWDET
jgi:hypothetical protein